jgi:hypothetical protein
MTSKSLAHVFCNVLSVVEHRVEDNQVPRAVDFPFEADDCHGMAWVLEIYRWQAGAANLIVEISTAVHEVGLYSFKKEFVGILTRISFGLEALCIAAVIDKLLQ